MTQHDFEKALASCKREISYLSKLGEDDDSKDFTMTIQDMKAVIAALQAAIAQPVPPVQNETGRDGDALKLFNEILDFLTPNQIGICEFHISSIRAALQQPAQGWRTIDSAPMDGNTFLAWNKNYIHGIGVTYWSDVYEKCMVGLLDQPTHWMPLPAAPDVGEVG